MALKAVVKISGVTNLSDARYCAGMGVEMVGFDLRPDSSEYINPLKFQEITGWIAGVKLVGEVHGLAEDSIREQLVKYPLDYLEIDDLSLVGPLQNTGIPLIVKVDSNCDPEKVLAECKSNAHIVYVLLEADPDADRAIVSQLAALPLLVGYQVSTTQAIELMETTETKGIALKGSNEIKPGFKDYDELSEILEALEED